MKKKRKRGKGRGKGKGKGGSVLEKDFNITNIARSEENRF